jgi:hypothetical protein
MYELALYMVWLLAYTAFSLLFEVCGGWRHACQEHVTWTQTYPLNCAASKCRERANVRVSLDAK